MFTCGRVVFGVRGPRGSFSFMRAVLPASGDSGASLSMSRGSVDVSGLLLRSTLLPAISSRSLSSGGDLLSGAACVWGRPDRTECDMFAQRSQPQLPLRRWSFHKVVSGSAEITFAWSSRVRGALVAA